MKNLEPKIFRQRLIIEGKYTIKITEDVIRKYLVELAKSIQMKMLIEPIIFTPNNANHPLHHGIAGFVGWVESGSSVYTWDRFSFFTVEIYTCKKFSVLDAVKFTKEFFKTSEIEHQEV